MLRKGEVEVGEKGCVRGRHAREIRAGLGSHVCDTAAALNVLWHACKGAAKSDRLYNAKIGIHTRFIGLGVHGGCR